MLRGRKRKKTYTKNKRKPKTSRRDKKRNKKRKPMSKNVKTKLNILLYSLCVAFICILLLSRYAQTTELQMKVTDKNKEIEELSEKKSQMNLKLEEIKESGLLEEQAKIRLNMRRAKDDQIIYLNIE